MSITITVTGRDGDQRDIAAPDGTSLMETLRSEGFGVLGTCGGMNSCGSCHVYVDSVAAPLEPVGEDERDMLDGLADVVEVKDTSRLSCQIMLTPALDRLHVTVAEQL